jgi:aquaporin Z
LTIVAVAYGLGGISGAHLNPAVSMGAKMAGRMSTQEMVQYWIAQTVGGIIGAFLLFYIVGTGAAGSNSVQDGYNVMNALAFEIIATFVFVTVILGVTGENGNAAFAGLAIGLTLTLVHLVGIPITGTSVNPARTIATNIFDMSSMGGLWIFIVGPLVGGALAGIVNKMGLTAQ